MKIIPAKYLPKDWPTNDVWQNTFRLPLGDYIDENLRIIDKDYSYLRSIFGISNSTLYSWKANADIIPQDKLVVIAHLFGVTIDQLLKRECNDDLTFEVINGYKSLLQKNVQYFSYHDLVRIWKALSLTEAYIKYYSRGYIGPTTLTIFNKNILGISSSETKYLCDCFDLNVKYYTKDGNTHRIESISFDELEMINERLKKDWGDDAPIHITVKHSEKYEKIALLSENVNFIDYLVVHCDVNANYLFTLWSTMDGGITFDTDYRLAKYFLYRGARFLDEESNIELMKQIIKHDAENLLKNKEN